MKNIGLVLEGGGMKGLYTAGVLNILWKKLIFPYVVGVSAELVWEQLIYHVKREK